MQIFKNDAEKRRAESIVYGMRSDRLGKEAMDRADKLARELDAGIRSGKVKAEDLVAAPGIYDHIMHFNSLAHKANSAMKDHVQEQKATADKLQSYVESGMLKAGRTISAATGKVIQEYVDAFRDHADKSLSIMKDHTKAVTNEADDLANTMQGSEVLYANDPGTPDPGQQEGVSKRRSPGTRIETKARTPGPFPRARSTTDQITDLLNSLPDDIARDLQRKCNACIDEREKAQLLAEYTQYLS